MLRYEHKAIRLLSEAEMRTVREKYPDRIMDCRYLLDDKWENGVYRSKARMIMPGHRVPGLERLVSENLPSSSAVMSFSRNLALQIKASLNWGREGSVSCIGTHEPVGGASLREGAEGRSW